MKILISTCFLTLAILSTATSSALSDRLAFNTGDSPLHKYAEQKQDLDFIKKLRKSNIYDLVGKGEITFSPEVESKFKNFRNHANGAFFYVSADGRKSGYMWCRGNYCNSRFGFKKSVAGRLKSAGEEWGQKAFLFALEKNYDWMFAGDFQGHVVWDFGAKSDKQIAIEIAQEKTRQDAERQRAAAERQRAEAERRRVEKERELAKQAAEKARLQAELRALKESQRDRLGEAFSSLGQSEREAIQQRLFERGLYQSTVDGAFGTGTRAAIEEYARPNNKIDL